MVDLMIQCNTSLTTLLLELRVDLQTLVSTLLAYNTHHEGDVLFWSTVPRVVKKKVAVVDEDSGGL